MFTHRCHTDSGLFEFVRAGQHCAHIFVNLEDLVQFASDEKCTALFMSRDRLQGFYISGIFNRWSSKTYPQGALFHAQCIHRSSTASNGNAHDYLECLDEDGYSIYLNMNELGRFSLIANTREQQMNKPERYLHSAQTAHLGQLLKRLTSSNTENNFQCVRLVRGPVPHNFHCQYLQFIRQHVHDVLVGLTPDDLVIEWNLDSHAACRYAINLNDILHRLSKTRQEKTLETYIDQARMHYRENFQINMQIVSSNDWTAFRQYWKWTGALHPTDDEQKPVSSQDGQRFNLVASIEVCT
jgi:hypothetical protein